MFFWFWRFHCTTAGTFNPRQTNLPIFMGFWERRIFCIWFAGHWSKHLGPRANNSRLGLSPRGKFRFVLFCFETIWFKKSGPLPKSDFEGRRRRNCIVWPSKLGFSVSGFIGKQHRKLCWSISLIDLVKRYYSYPTGSRTIRLKW